MIREIFLATMVVGHVVHHHGGQTPERIHGRDHHGVSIPPPTEKKSQTTTNFLQNFINRVLFFSDFNPKLPEMVIGVVGQWANQEIRVGVRG